MYYISFNFLKEREVTKKIFEKIKNTKEVEIVVEEKKGLTSEEENIIKVIFLFYLKKTAIKNSKSISEINRYEDALKYQKFPKDLLINDKNE
jgi:hypothetical protein